MGTVEQVLVIFQNTAETKANVWNVDFSKCWTFALKIVLFYFVISKTHLQQPRSQPTKSQDLVYKRDNFFSKRTRNQLTKIPPAAKWLHQKPPIDNQSDFRRKEQAALRKAKSAITKESSDLLQWRKPTTENNLPDCKEHAKEVGQKNTPTKLVSTVVRGEGQPLPFSLDLSGKVFHSQRWVIWIWWFWTDASYQVHTQTLGKEPIQTLWMKAAIVQAFLLAFLQKQSVKFSQVTRHVSPHRDACSVPEQ